MLQDEDVVRENSLNLNPGDSEHGSDLMLVNTTQSKAVASHSSRVESRE